MSELTPGVIASMALFAFVMSVTPGPNNMMLLASGVNFGFRSTLRHLFGVCGGLVAILVAAGLGLQQVFTSAPALHEVVKWLGVGYMLYLAWRIARSGKPAGAQSATAQPAPIGFWGASAFQLVNPKVWVMVVGFYGTYVPGHADVTVVLVSSLLFGIVNLPCVGSWALLGQQLRGVLNDESRRRKFNYAMALLLVASLWTVV